MPRELKEKKEIFGYPCEGTKKQIEEMTELLNTEHYMKPRFQKYFYVWDQGEGTGICWFPKEQYCQAKGNNYIVALAQYMGHEEAAKSYYSVD